MQRNRKHASGRARVLIALVVLLLALGGSLLSTAAQRPNGAGLVIRHGDGTLIYAYVQFEEESITGLDLITRSGIDATLAPFGGLGGAVCSLNGEGCPSDNCFCHSYASPAYYWNYYVHSGDDWSSYPVGPSSRTLSDGDIDGWSWTAAESGLPVTNIDEIARMNGVDRSRPSATATLEPLPPTAAPEPPTPTTPPEPAPTRTLASQPTNTQMAVSNATVTPAATATSIMVSVPSATVSPTGTPSPPATAPSTVASAASSTVGPASTSQPTATATAVATASPVATSRAVIVAPGATPAVLTAIDSTSSDGETGYLMFAGMLVLVVALGAGAFIRNRFLTR